MANQTHSQLNDYAEQQLAPSTSGPQHVDSTANSSSPVSSETQVVSTVGSSRRRTLQNSSMLAGSMIEPPGEGHVFASRFRTVPTLHSFISPNSHFAENGAQPFASRKRRPQPTSAQASSSSVPAANQRTRKPQQRSSRTSNLNTSIQTDASKVTSEQEPVRSRLRKKARIDYSALSDSSHGSSQAIAHVTAGILSSEIQKLYLTIGIDFGMTFTSVCYLLYSREDAEKVIYPMDGKAIGNWPSDDPGSYNLHVPSEIWYSSSPKSRRKDMGVMAPAPVVHRSDAGTDSDSDSDSGEDSQNEGPNGGSNDSDLFWGFQCPAERYNIATIRSLHRHVTGFKSSLLDTEHTEEDREALDPVIQTLITSGYIREYGAFRDNAHDVIVDYLVCVLRHTKAELVAQEEYNANTDVNFAITVPVNFSKKSRTRLQWALEEASRISAFGKLIERSIDNLFFETEPKAAAAYLLGIAKDTMAGSTFMVCDCGGGTVDASTFSVANAHPLKLGDPICEPSGDNCGSSFLKDNFRKLMLEKLADERQDLETNGTTLEATVDRHMLYFENHLKRKNIYSALTARLWIDGLKGDEQKGRRGRDAKGFEKNVVCLSQNDFNIIFIPILDRVCKVVHNQLEASRGLKKEIKRIFLIGGFGGCLSLHTHLQNFLSSFQREKRLTYTIELVRPRRGREYVTAQAAGAVLLL